MRERLRPAPNRSIFDIADAVPAPKIRERLMPATRERPQLQTKDLTRANNKYLIARVKAAFPYKPHPEKPIEKYLDDTIFSISIHKHQFWAGMMWEGVQIIQRLQREIAELKGE